MAQAENAGETGKFEVTGDDLMTALVDGVELMRRELDGIGPVGIILAGLDAIEAALGTAASMVMMLDDAVDDDERSVTLNNYALVVWRVKYQLFREIGDEDDEE